ncbi:tectonic-1-like [Oratosquilla oratoria]|uniref:tectonic-1-like n=1 Tax=Oratosquilla oratoria TaxID=337810 RepID=UPI003F76E199
MNTLIALITFLMATKCLSEENPVDTSEITTGVPASLDYDNLENVTQQTNYSNLFNVTDYDYPGADTTDIPENNTVITTTESPISPEPEDRRSVITDFCLCDLLDGSCDINCCCDEDCSAEDLQVFSKCIERPQPVLDSRYCYQQHLLFSNNTEYKVDHVDDGLLCILVDNLPQRTFYSYVEKAETLEEYEELRLEPHFTWQWHEEFKEAKFTESPYHAGSPIWVLRENRSIQAMGISSPLVRNVCEAFAPLEYLYDVSTECVQLVYNLEEQCSRNTQLNSRFYTDLLVVADPHNLYKPEVTSTESSKTTESSTLPTEMKSSSIEPSKAAANTTLAPSSNSTEESTPVPVSEKNSTFNPKEEENINANETDSQPSANKLEISHTIKNISSSLKDQILGKYNSQNPINPNQVITVNSMLCFQSESMKEINCQNMTIPQPLFVNGECQNVVSSVEYKIFHNGTKGIKHIQALVYLRNVSQETEMPFVAVKQKFKVHYIWASETLEDIFYRSGRPGYVVGKPLLMGKRVVNVTDVDEDGKEAILLSRNPQDWLTILSAGTGSTCQRRTNVLFRQDMRSGCIIHASPKELRNNCEELQKKILLLLHGNLNENFSELRVAMYGDASVENTGDWIPILRPEEPRAKASSPGTTGECLGLILSLHMEIAYAMSGALSNPQAKVVSVVFHYGQPKDVESLCTGITCQSSDSKLALEIISSVSFIDTSKPPLAHYASPPTVDIKLPYDFFYPFLPSRASSHRSVYHIVLSFLITFVVVFR